MIHEEDKKSVIFSLTYMQNFSSLPFAHLNTHSLGPLLTLTLVFLHSFSHTLSLAPTRFSSRSLRPLTLAHCRSSGCDSAPRTPPNAFTSGKITATTVRRPFHLYFPHRRGARLLVHRHTRTRGCHKIRKLRFLFPAF